MSDGFQTKKVRSLRLGLLRSWSFLRSYRFRSSRFRNNWLRALHCFLLTGVSIRTLKDLSSTCTLITSAHIFSVAIV